MRRGERGGRRLVHGLRDSVPHRVALGLLRPRGRCRRGRARRALRPDAGGLRRGRRGAEASGGGEGARVAGGLRHRALLPAGARGLPRGARGRGEPPLSDGGRVDLRGPAPARPRLLRRAPGLGPRRGLRRGGDHGLRLSAGVLRVRPRGGAVRLLRGARRRNGERRPSEPPEKRRSDARDQALHRCRVAVHRRGGACERCTRPRSARAPGELRPGARRSRTPRRGLLPRATSAAWTLGTWGASPRRRRP